MKRRKCELIDANLYDELKPIIAEDNYHRYVKGAYGPIRVQRKTCCVCASTASYVGIFTYKTYSRVERFCGIHGKIAESGKAVVSVKT